MSINIKRTFVTFLAVTAVLLLGRVFLSFAFIAGSITTSLGQAPGSAAQLMTTGVNALHHLSANLTPGYRRPSSVFDVPDAFKDGPWTLRPPEVRLTEAASNALFIDVAEAEGQHRRRPPSGALLLVVPSF
jgi:hypothetical protein